MMPPSRWFLAGAHCPARVLAVPRSGQRGAVETKRDEASAAHLNNRSSVFAAA